MSTAAATSVAGKVLRTRALQCSFSSVFHLRRAGMGQRDADLVETLFVATVGVPLAILGASGLYAAALSNRNTASTAISNDP
jgi:hypothetical protein